MVPRVEGGSPNYHKIYHKTFLESCFLVLSSHHVNYYGARVKQHGLLFLETKNPRKTFLRILAWFLVPAVLINTGQLTRSPTRSETKKPHKTFLEVLVLGSWFRPC